MSGLEGRDWDMLEAAKRSIREHMAICKDLKNQIAELKAEKKAVIGQYKIMANGDREGTVISSGEWPKLIGDAGLSGQWVELAFRVIK